MTTAMSQQLTTVRTVSGIDIVAGIWLIAAPFILGYSSLTNALWNDVAIGVVVGVLSVIRVSNQGIHNTVTSWLSVIAGVWLIASPFIIGYSVISATAMANDIILGVIVAVFALSGALLNPSDTIM